MSESPLHWFWAKLGNHNWPEKYHPVMCHLIDVGQVAHAIWRHAMRPKPRAWLAERLGLDLESTGRWVAFWISTHDIGKITSDFQYRDNKTNELKSRGFKAGFKSNIGKAVAHGSMGTKILFEERINVWQTPETRETRRLAIALGGHHGVFPLKYQDHNQGTEAWRKAQRQALKLLQNLYGVADLPQPTINNSDDQSIWIFLAGLTSVADWIGSNSGFFDYIGSPEVAEKGFDLNAYFQKSGEQAVVALEKLGWLNRASLGQELPFERLFPHITKRRPLQDAVIEMVDGSLEPGLIIVEAPMGEGKTEAGWYAAACWDARGGQGAYVALPTMATSDQMFERVGQFLLAMGGRQNLMLQHGKALLNERFEIMEKLAEIYDDVSSPSAVSVVVAERWFAENKKHRLLAPYGVGTIDQALLAVLQVKHMFVRLFGLAGKCVVLDEVHAYDVYMTTLMTRLLKWLAALGCPVVLLSATLPSRKRLELMQAYSGREPHLVNVPYPRVTQVQRDGTVKVVPIEADKQRNRTVTLRWLQVRDAAGMLQEALSDGGCAVVICNTVSEAQETYKTIRDLLKPVGFKVELFHARFLFGQRMDIQKRVLDGFGKTSDSSTRDKRILVSTQVVEQSLDLDFDVMISFLAPIDLVLQRAGRLWRHERTRPARLQAAGPQLWLIEPEEDKGVPTFGKSVWVYEKYILLRSYLALKNRRQVNLPEDLEALVENVYSDDLSDVPAAWRSELDKSKQKMEDEQNEQMLKAKGVEIPEPTAEDVLRQQNLQLSEDDPEVHPTLQAATRDAGPSISLIVVYRLGDQDYLDLAGTLPFDEKVKPTRAEIRRILENEVSVPRKDCVNWYKNCPGPKAWETCGMLRYHRLVRVGADGRSLAEEYQLQVDPELGLTFENS